MSSFFENQQLARRNTRVLVILYALAVAGVIVAVDLVLAGFYAASLDFPPGADPGFAARLAMAPQGLRVWGAILTALVIFAVSGWHVLRLASGGKVVAEMVGARRVEPGSRDPLERRLLNVVEEMAIASGVRVPAVYVMDGEAGINAFAAGYEPSDCVIAVTRGTLQVLNRDELQGVIGHEFSHILHGDMRLNIRMIGVLAGIVFVGSVGGFLMRRSPDADKAAPAMFAGGLMLFLIGYTGLFFARLIKAAVSRQREFLADASSVQYTRNPEGLAGALDQIGQSPAGAFVADRHAEDLSHMFFGQAIHVRLASLFDTHPPIDERIARVASRFERAAYRRRRPDPAPRADEGEEAARRGAAAAVLAAAANGRRGADLGTEWGRSAGESARMVGSVDAGKVDYAARLLGTLPAGLREQLRDPGGAGAAVVALLLAPKDDVMKAQLDAVAAKGLQPLAARAAALAPLARGLGPAYHLTVVDLALPALKQAPEPARRELVAAVEAAIHADRRVSLHEFVIFALLGNQLLPQGKASQAGRRRIAELRSAALLVLSLVVHAGTRQDATGARGDALQAAMRAGCAEMGLPEIAPASGLAPETAAAALEQLKALAPMQKAVFVKGLFAAVTSDGTIRVVEAELMRLVGAVLDCPLPPLLDSIDPATLAS